MDATTSDTGRSARVEMRYDIEVPMPDGVRLAGNLFLPDENDIAGPYPAILMFIPYHKDGRGAVGVVDAWHRYFASQGYACVHLDFRGTGSSEGMPHGPFDRMERVDGHHAVEWIAAQPWCTGAVGVWGASYGGITALSIAETRPPHLNAIVAIHAPDDPHGVGFVYRDARVMLMADLWGDKMVASNLMPPMRSDGASDWLRKWRQRLERTPWILDWHGEPPDREFWDRQRIDTSKIDVPCFLINGWHDTFIDSMSRMYDTLGGPKRFLLGPWKHEWPDRASREPVGAIREIERWWDRYLKGIANQIESEPPVMVFAQGIDEWRSEMEWPLSRASGQTFYPRPDQSLGDETGSVEDGAKVYRYDPRAGLSSLPYDPGFAALSYPQDQLADDRLSLCYTTGLLDEDFEISGEPALRLTFTTTTAVENINVIAKICDVTPDGESHMVSYGVAAGSRAEALEADGDGPLHTITVELRPTSYVVQAGHAIRLTLSGSLFPQVWPTATPYELTVCHSGPRATSLTLPRAARQEPELPAPALGPPIEMPTPGRIDGDDSYEVRTGLLDRSLTFAGRNSSLIAGPDGSKILVSQAFQFSVDADHPDAATSLIASHWELRRAAGSVTVRSRCFMTQHDIQVTAEADLDGNPYYRGSWHKSRDRA